MRGITKQVKVLYTNADSLYNKLSELKLVIHEHDPDVVAVTEVKPKKTNFPLQQNHILLPGFQSPVENLDVPGRGVCVYIKDGIDFEVLDIGQSFPQSVWVRLKLGRDSSLDLGCVYRSRATPDALNTELHNIVKTVLGRVNPPTVIVGDFNYPEIDWETNRCSTAVTHPAARFLEMVSDSLGEQLVKYPTRHRQGQRSTRDDLVLVNKPELIEDEIRHLPALGKSDHNLLSFNISHPKCARTPPPCPFRYSYLTADYQTMSEDLANQNLHEQMKDLDVIDSWNLLKRKIVELRDRYVPRSRVVIGKGKKVRPLWMNQKALRKVRKKHSAYRRYLQTKDGEDYQAYVAARNASGKATRAAVKSFEKKIAKDCKQNPKAFWSYYSSQNKTHSDIPTLEDERGKKFTTDKEKAEALNSFFSSVFTKEEATNIPHVPKQTRSTMEPLHFTEEEVLKVLGKLKTNKSPGADEIHPKIIYELRFQLTSILTDLFNKSVETGTIPPDWKEAHVVPIHKKGSRHDPCNYRPISLTSVVCKLLESLIRDKMWQHLDQNDLVSDHTEVAPQIC